MSRALSEAESRYSQIEKECLAFTWMCERSSDYILGKPIIGETDHKPLVPLLMKYTLEQVPPRIQRFRTRLMRFNIQEMNHVPGKEMYTSDMLSRQLPAESAGKSMVDDEDMVHFLESIIDSLPVSDVKLQQIIAAQAEESVCSKIMEYILEGWPDKYQMPDALKPYWDFREFTHFAKQWDIELVPSSPKYPQSNGEVERAVQTIKNILKKEKELPKALLAYRTTPLRNGYSPAELLMGRRLRSTVPTFHENLIPRWPDIDKLREHENIQKMQQHQHLNTRHRARLLPQLSAGASVAIAKYDEKGIMQKKSNSPRQYVVSTPTSTLRRNRVHLIPLPETSQSQSTQESKDCQEDVADTRTFEQDQSPLNILSRPRRTIKPSLKVRENLENNI